MRAGIGYDSHRFDENRPLVLGGVELPDAPGLAAHSDGDAVAHAVIDALLGATALGDVGRLFPDTDPRFEQADSMSLLSEVVAAIEARNFQVVNLDVTIVAERPRISTYAERIRARLADVLHIGPDHVSVKGKTNEGMGWIGRGEGVAVMCVATVNRVGDIDALLASLRSGG